MASLSSLSSSSKSITSSTSRLSSTSSCSSVSFDFLVVRAMSMTCQTTKPSSSIVIITHLPFFDVVSFFSFFRFLTTSFTGTTTSSLSLSSSTSIALAVDTDAALVAFFACSRTFRFSLNASKSNGADCLRRLNVMCFGISKFNQNSSAAARCWWLDLTVIAQPLLQQLSCCICRIIRQLLFGVLTQHRLFAMPHFAPIL
jgi:hypothetical protein